MKKRNLHMYGEMSPRDYSHNPSMLKQIIEHCSPFQHSECSVRLKKLKTQE